MEENKNLDWKSVPVYKDSPAAAREKNELDAYRASSAANQACAKAIVETIRENWNGSRLKDGCAQPVMEVFGADRLAFVLANTVDLRAYDTRFSKQNREWAQMALAGADAVIPEDKRVGWEIDIHTTMLNDFTEQAREAIENLTTLETPVYYESFQYATENEETGPFWESYNCNRECRNAIEEAIADHFDGYRLSEKATGTVLQKYGEERTLFVLANTIQLLRDDGRFSRQNIQWADAIPVPHGTEQDASLRRDFLIRSHPGLINLVTQFTRKEAQRAKAASKAQDRPSILAELEKPLAHAKKDKQPNQTKGQER